MKKFEYKIVLLSKSLDELNKFGLEGWELVYFGSNDKSIFKKEIDNKTEKNLGVLNDQFSDEINLENLKKESQ